MKKMILSLSLAVAGIASFATPSFASEADIVLPVLDQMHFGFTGYELLKFGIVICLLGMLFGLALTSPAANPSLA